MNLYLGPASHRPKEFTAGSSHRWTAVPYLCFFHESAEEWCLMFAVLFVWSLCIFTAGRSSHVRRMLKWCVLLLLKLLSWCSASFGPKDKRTTVPSTSCSWNDGCLHDIPGRNFEKRVALNELKLNGNNRLKMPQQISRSKRANRDPCACLRGFVQLTAFSPHELHGQLTSIEKVQVQMIDSVILASLSKLA